MDLEPWWPWWQLFSSAWEVSGLGNLTSCSRSSSLFDPKQTESQCFFLTFQKSRGNVKAIMRAQHTNRATKDCIKNSRHNSRTVWPDAYNLKHKWYKMPTVSCVCILDVNALIARPKQLPKSFNGNCWAKSVKTSWNTANQIMTIKHMLMTAKRAKSINIGKINAKIAKLILPKWDLGKFKATMACSIPTMGLPFMRLTFWLGPSMVRLLVGPRAEQSCSN